MSFLTPVKKQGRFIGIKADGFFHEKVDAGTEGAVLREYELKDGTHGSKWELLYEDVKNVLITNVEFEDSDFGQNILITCSDGENEVVIAESTSGNFGTDLMKKLPNIDLTQPVTIKPYAFKDEKTGKDRRGVTIYAKGDKVMNFFYDAEKKAELHDFPIPEGDKTAYDKDDWKVYYISVKKFLVKYVQDNIIPKFQSETVKRTEYPQEDINPEDIPF